MLVQSARLLYTIEVVTTKVLSKAPTNRAPTFTERVEYLPIAAATRTWRIKLARFGFEHNPMPVALWTGYAFRHVVDQQSG
jgi:hypothetical protein